MHVKLTYQTSDISRTLVGHKVVDHSDAVGFNILRKGNETRSI